MPVGSAWGEYKGNLFGRDRIGHTTTPSMLCTTTSQADGLEGLLMHPNEFTLPKDKVIPMARYSQKMSSNNAPIGRAGTVTKASNSYNAANVR